MADKRILLFLREKSSDEFGNSMGSVLLRQQTDENKMGAKRTNATVFMERLSKDGSWLNLISNLM